MVNLGTARFSKSRVPRWFTEGLAEFETTLARPEWKREMDGQLWRAHKAGKLKGIDTEESEWRFYVHGRAVPL